MLAPIVDEHRTSPVPNVLVLGDTTETVKALLQVLTQEGIEASSFNPQSPIDGVDGSHFIVDRDLLISAHADIKNKIGSGFFTAIVVDLFGYFKDAFPVGFQTQLSSSEIVRKWIDLQHQFLVDTLSQQSNRTKLIYLAPQSLPFDSITGSVLRDIQSEIVDIAQRHGQSAKQSSVVVNCVIPNYVLDDHLRSLAETLSLEGSPDTELVLLKIAEQCPAKRFATPSELAMFIAFLCTMKGSFASGEVIHFDGGGSLPA